MADENVRGAIAGVWIGSWSVLSMSTKYSSFKLIVGECEQCGDFWEYEGWDNGRWYKVYISERNQSSAC
jgi:hypothetical protein